MSAKAKAPQTIDDVRVLLEIERNVSITLRAKLSHQEAQTEIARHQCTVLRSEADAANDQWRKASEDRSDLIRAVCLLAGGSDEG